MKNALLKDVERREKGLPLPEQTLSLASGEKIEGAATLMRELRNALRVTMQMKHPKMTAWGKAIQRVHDEAAKYADL
jgi:hypothetical protein